MGHREAREKCKDIVKLLGIDHRLDHRPSELSGGQKQRVSIARALASEPAILLADEPTGALDSSSGQDVLKLFRELNDMGNTIVMITHDLKVAKAAKRIVKIVDGQLSDYTE
jgi:putative ABC transport system ATP-binding protein